MEETCKQCKVPTQLVFDYTTGDVICTNCAVVQEQRIVEDSFQEIADNDPYDRSKEVSNPLLIDTKLDLSTIIKHDPEVSSFNVSTVSNSEKNDCLSIQEQRLKDSLKDVEYLCEVLCLGTIDLTGAQEICKTVYKKGLITSKNKKAVAAACVFIKGAENNRMSVHTIQNKCTDISINELKRMITMLGKEIKEGGNCSQKQVPSPKSYITRFCDPLNLPREVVLTAHQAAAAAETLDLRRKPTSIAAATIYLVSGLPRDVIHKQYLQNISSVTGVSRKTIYETFIELIAYEDIILPH